MNRAARILSIAAALAAIASATPVIAQTDFYNTDAGRPITIEDAYPTERYAFELQLAPLRLERENGGVYNWSVEPELAYGILPRTHVELGVPIGYVDAGRAGRRSGVAGLDLSVLHNLNAETSIPALSLLGEVVFPVGPLAAERTYVSGKAIATRTLSWARFHVNGRYTWGKAPASPSTLPTPVVPTAAGREQTRWLAGLAVDRTYPLKSLLITAETFAAQPLRKEEEVEWNAGAGVRYQLTPYFAIDGGVGKRLTGANQSWYATFGLSRAFAIRALMPSK